MNLKKQLKKKIKKSKISQSLIPKNLSLDKFLVNPLNIIDDTKKKNK